MKHLYFDDRIDYAWEYCQLQFVCKWGCDDSSGHILKKIDNKEADDTDYRQNVITDCTIFLFSIVPFRLTGITKVSNTEVVLWENPSLSFNR